ncbi:tetratricopeptide repeat protein [Bremerella sp. P1]|uniref:tetratricopeptide repeat protein n=1 Tax=Bremerella sp. P1 TaxID=3026424 RepID=UPI002367ADB7|nr:tetratricopeptide repeat protein [Bremerella sp. P1]WDI40002.1 tetratricopeptide repeat protein [Bremerella sp. P1]
MRLALFLMFVAIGLCPSDAFAQRKPKEEPLELPTDPRLVEIHREFVTKAEKLGDEYARKKDWEKARIVFGEVLKLVPNYKPAVEKMKVINGELSNANKKLVTVEASEGWQDTGINVIEGSPIAFRVEGEWLLVHPSDANGLEIPREIRDYKLGSLIGVVAKSATPDKDTVPFTIGTQKRMNVPQTGRLLLKMHDLNNEDNRGQVRVEITGNF